MVPSIVRLREHAQGAVNEDGQAVAAAVRGESTTAEVSSAEAAGAGWDPGLLHQAFQRRALLDPDAVAVVIDGREFAYAEIDRAANRLARYLRNEHGIGPEDKVGIMVNRSERIVIGILGILKAGAAYVPIDPQYPRPVVLQMLDDAAVDACLVDSDYVAVVGSLPKALQGIIDKPGKAGKGYRLK